MKALIDNDILLKGACYGLLEHLLTGICASPDHVGTLGAARFVVSKRIERRPPKKGADAAIAALQGFLNRSSRVEPSPAEQDMASQFEFAALRLSLTLDAGESQLCAILVLRVIPFFLTGDKRAITVLEQLLDSDNRLLALCGKVRCLEQLVLDMLTMSADDSLRRSICAEPDVDQTLTICFSCHSAEASGSHSEGLKSYIADLRNQAARVLSA
jgi:hypothetical protein